jgi:hypothetical protein
MKTTTAKKRLEALTDKSLGFNSLSKSSKAYQFANQIISGTNVIRPCYTLGRGKYTSNQDHTRQLVYILNKINIKFKLTNDAPKGSPTGNIITVTTKFN